MGIPLAIAGAIVGFATLIKWSDTGEDVTDLVGLSVVCEVAAIACPIIAVSYKTKRKRCNEAAINLLNRKYSKQ